MAKTGVIGAGSWGTALALVLHNNGHEVTLWSHSAASVESLLKNRELKDKLPGVKIPEAIQITNDLQQAVKNMDMLVLAVPSACIRSTAHNMAPCVADGQLIVCVSKGIEESTLKIMTEVIEDEIPNCRAAVLSGPSHAEEVSRGLPTTVVAGAHDRETAEYIQNLFMNRVFRVYTSPDMLGIELGGALKNVIALAAGIADGLGYGDNTKAALITRGIAEMSRIGTAMGGRQETFNGLSGIGDLIVTCASVHSRNRRAGYLIGQGRTMREAMDEVKMVVEGVYSAKAAVALARKYNIEIPIIEQVNKALFEDKSPKEAVTELMLRDKKSKIHSSPGSRREVCPCAAITAIKSLTTRNIMVSVPNVAASTGRRRRRSSTRLYMTALGTAPIRTVTEAIAPTAPIPAKNGKAVLPIRRTGIPTRPSRGRRRRKRVWASLCSASCSLSSVSSCLWGP